MAISFEEWSNQKRNQTASAAPSTVSTNKQNTVAPAQSTAGATASSFEEWSNAKRNQKESTDVNAWIESANRLAGQYGNLTSSWHGENDPAYTNFSNERSRILANAQGFREQYAGNQEALDAIDSVVKSLSDMSTWQTEDYYSNWGSEKEYKDAVADSNRRTKYSTMDRASIDNILADTTGKNGDQEWLQNYIDSGAYDLDQYSGLRNNSDFKSNSQYRSTANGKENFNALTGMWLDTGYDDPTYEYINKNQEAVNRTNATNVANWSSFLGVDQNFLQQMTSDEIGTFNYLYNTQGKDAAYEYVTKLGTNLTARQRQQETERWAEYAKENPVAMSLFSVVESPAKLFSYLGQVQDYAEDGKIDQNAGYNKFVYDNSAIRNAVSEDMGEVGKFFYQTGMSMGDFLWTTAITGGFAGGGEYAVASKVMEGINLAIMGTGAAADTTMQAKDRGLSDDQAFWLGQIAGAAEIATEVFSVEKLINPDLMKDGVAKYIFENTLTEGLEEVGSDIINLVADTLISGDLSELNQQIQDYINSGKPEDQARRQAYLEKAFEVFLDFAGGALSGAAMSGGSVVGSNLFGEGKTYKKEYGGSVSDLVDEALATNPDNQLAQKIKEKLSKGKGVSGLTIAQLVTQNETAARSGDVSKIADRLTTYGETGDVNKIAESIAKFVTGEKLTHTDRRNIFQSKYGQRVANELNPDNIGTGEYNNEWARNLNTERINPELYTRETTQEDIVSRDAFNLRTAPEGTLQTGTYGSNVYTANPFAQNAPVSDVQNNREQNNVPVAETATEANNTVPVQTVEQTTTSQPAGTIVDESKEAEPVTLESAAEAYGSRSGAFIGAYNNGQDIGQYSRDYQKIYDYGQSYVPMDYVRKQLGSTILTERQMEIAYETGRAAADEKASNKVSKRKEMANGKTGRRIGAAKLEGAKMSDLNKVQQTAVRVGQFISEALGINIVFRSSSADANGNYTEANGMFDPNNPDTIYIDLNAGLENIKDAQDAAKYVLMCSLNHELVHFGEYWSAQDYNQLRAAVFDELAYRGQNLDDMIEQQMMDTDMDYEAASREVVAEALTEILPESHFIENIVNSNKTLAQKLLDKIKNFVADLKAYFSELKDVHTPEAKSLRTQIDGTIKYSENIIDLFDRMMTSATENYQNAYAEEEEYVYDPKNKYAIDAKEYIESKGYKFAINDLSAQKHMVQVDVDAYSYPLFSMVIESDEDWAKLKQEVDDHEDSARRIKEEIEQKKLKAPEGTKKNESAEPAPAVTEPKTTTSKNGYTVSEGTEAGYVEVKFDGKPSETVRNALKASKFRWNGKKGVWYGKATNEHISDVLDSVYDNEAKTQQTAEEQTKVEPKEVDVTGLLNAVSNAQETANKTGEEQQVKISDHYVEETAPTEENVPALDEAYTELYKHLGVNSKTIRNGFMFNIVDYDGTYYGYITRVSEAGGVPIEDAKHLYDADFNDPDNARIDLALVAQNNNLLKPKETVDATPEKEYSQDTETAKEVTDNGQEVSGQRTGEPAVRQDNEGTVSVSESDGEGTPRLLDEVETEDVQRAGGSRETAAVDTVGGNETGRNGDRESAGSGDRRSEGAGESGDLRRSSGGDRGESGRDVGTGESERGNVADIHEGNGGTESQPPKRKRTVKKKATVEETVTEQIEQQSKTEPKGTNFVIGDSLNLPSGEKARFQANVSAIRLIKQLETEGRYATAAEQEILSKYVGWGGLSNAFGELTWNRETRKEEMVAKKGWENEFTELRSLVDEGIITQKEYEEMSASTKNAHYTSVEVIKAMYDGLAQLGFNGGRMLEPSSGVGNFVGGMPVSMSQNVRSWTMVELDRVTGLIGKYLYPNADMRIQGFEQANIPDNYMDVAIGNVPFGNYGVFDKAYPKRITKAIHNYFFAKAIDKVRPGGVVMFITSSFTMNGKDNALRQYIMDKADLLGAIRLPNTAFAGNAGTSVVTDILILKKRSSGTEYAGETFLDAHYQQIGEDRWQAAEVNEYFINHPEMVLGTPEIGRNMYGPDSLTYNPLEGRGTLGDQIREAFKNITGKMDYNTATAPEKTNFAVERASKKTKNGGLEVKEDGKVYKNDNGKLVEVESKDTDFSARVSGLLGIRDAYRNLVNYMQQGQDAKFIKQARTALNKAYDEFVKKYGYLNSVKNKSALEDDPDKYSILSLENYNAKEKTATKADIFTKDTITPNKTINHVDDVSAGVIVSMNRTGGIDVSMIASLTGKSEDDVTKELVSTRQAFKTKDGILEAPSVYLAGNVRAKLREAEALVPFDKDYQNNVDELKKVVPKDVPFNEIGISVGTPWIPNNVYADFIAYILGGHNVETDYRNADVEVGRTNSGEFKIALNNSRLKSNYRNTQTWGTKRRTFLQLMESMLSSGSVTVYDTEPDGKTRVLNKVETDAANAKVEEITKEFQDWLWKDETRKEQLSKLYNETFNALATPKYDGSNLTVNGINSAFSLREHQANAVQRIISSGGNTLLAHRVGAGKTLEMAAAAMKLRELGIVKKPVFVVPKSLVAQWGVEFKNYFPASKLLVADENSFTKANRKVNANRIANGDYDAIIISYEQFEKIPMSKEYQEQFYRDQIQEIIAAIAEEKAETKGKGITVKEMEKKKAQLEKKIAELTSKEKDEENIDFEQLGIDSLFVDEAHNFKNLQYVTRMNNVAGLGNKNGSQRAFDLYTKVRYLQKLNGGRGIVFATATPVMNSMAEMYIMQRYLQPDMLEELGLKTFDAWAKQFGEIVNSIEVNPSGVGFRQKQTFSNFINLNELQLLFRSFSDVLTQVPGLKIPKMKGGAVKVVQCEPGQFQKDYMAEIQKRAENVKNVDPKEDNMLKITSDGKKVSYTQRMIDPSLPYEEGCKIYRCCDNVLQEYKDSKAIKGTQIIFCDMATPKGRSNTAKDTDENVDTSDLDTDSARLYDDMRAYLVKKGIPAKEIAFIHEADTDAKKKQLFEDVNEGKVRVLIGSTGKMGVGMNAQKRIVAIHHLDAPWRPGDVEQRDGRAFRQKNMNEEVSKYVYVTKGSFDARLWDILDRKTNFINQIMNGEDVGRSAEDTGEVTLSAAEVKAMAVNDPEMKEFIGLEKDIQRLKNLKKAYDASLVAARNKMFEDEQKIRYAEKALANAKEDIKSTRVDTYSDDKFSMTVGNKTITDKKDAGAALGNAIVSKAKDRNYVTVGKFAGFEMQVMKDGVDYFGRLVGAGEYKFNVYPQNTTYMITHITGVVQGLETRVKDLEARLTETRDDLAAQEHIMNAPFAKQEEYNTKMERYTVLNNKFNPKNEQTIGDGEGVQYQRRVSRLNKAIEEAAENAEYEEAYMNGDMDRAKELVLKRLNDRNGIIPFDYAGKYRQSNHAEIAKQIKVGNMEAITAAAADMAEHVPENAVLIPMTGRTGIARDTEMLALAISRLTKAPVANVLKGVERKSQYESKKAGHPLTSEEMGVYLAGELPEGKIPVVVDNVVASGTTAKAAIDAIGSGIVLGYAYGANTKPISGLKYSAVTFDEDGNLIPLARRGDIGDERIQYQIRRPTYTTDDLKKNSIKLQSMESVGTFTGNELGSQDIPPKYRVKAFFDSLGNNVSTEQFGDVALTNSSMRSDIRHGSTPVKVVTYAAIPAVLQNGVAIYHNTKNEYGTERIVVAAPVMVGNPAEKMYVGVMLQRDPQSQRLYLHDVVTEKELVNFNSRSLNPTGLTVEGDNLYVTDILLNALNVKSEDLAQDQQRRSVLTDRDVLMFAANELYGEDAKKGNLTEAELDALNIFQSRLDKLYELQTKRTEEGRLYREQQFGENVDRDEAQKTLNRMKILDEQIRKANNDVLDVENKEVLRKVLVKARNVVEQDERMRGQEALRRYRNRRNNAAAVAKYRNRIQSDTETLTKWITHPSNKDALHHVPDALKNTVIPFLTSIDFTSKRQLRGGAATQADAVFMENMKKLRDALKQNINVNGLYSGYSDLPEGFMEDMQTYIDATQALINQNTGTFVINQMTAEELHSLSKMVRVVKSLIVNMNSFHQNAMFKHTTEAGDSSIAHMQELNDAGNTNTITDFLLWQQIRPAYAFERFGKGGISIYDEFRNGQAKLAFNTMKIKEFAESTYTDAEVKAWEKETKTFDINGAKVKVPVSYLMGLYELTKREQAAQHLLGGGLRVATFMDGKQKVSDNGHELTPQIIAEMVNSLSPRQMEVADKLQQFMANQGGAWGNYVSVARFGEELFGEEHYYPIASDGRLLKANADEAPSAASLYALLNMSFTKELNENANNRVVLYSIFDVFANHMASMAQYNAFALPILDSLKWLNYQQTVDNDDGTKTVVDSVREQMARTYGVPEESRPGKGRTGYAESFVLGIIKAFNGTETQGVASDSMGMNALHKFNMAQVAYNFRVVAQQPLSIARAALLLDYKSILKGLRLAPSAIRANIAEMEKYSGIAAWKSLGFYDVNISRGLTDLIKHNETFMDKVGDIGMAGAELADKMTWASMWSACKEQVIRKEHLKPGMAGFYEAVTKLFEDVIYKTQVVDSVLTKNEFLRSKGWWTRAIGSFMSEPTTSASMLIDAYDKYRTDKQRGLTSQQAWQKNGKHIVRTAYVYGISALLLATVTGIVDAWRDDDDYASFFEKWLKAFKGNLEDEINPINKLPIMRDAYEVFKSVLEKLGFDTYGNEPRSVIFQWSDYLTKATEIFADKINGEQTNYTWYGGAYKLLQTLSGITGLPLADADRELIDAWNNIVGGMAPSLKVKTYDAGTRNNIKYAYQDGYLTSEEAIDKLLESGTAKDQNDAYWTMRGFDGDSKYASMKEAIKAGDQSAYNEAMSDLIAHGVKEKDAQSNARTYIGNLYKGTDKEPASISQSEAVSMLITYGGKTREEADSMVKKWKFGLDNGFEYDDLQERYVNGYVSYGKAVSYRINYGGESDDKAIETVDRWTFIGNNDNYSDITAAAVGKYNTYCVDAGISKAVYFDAWNTMKDFTGEDLDGDGKSDAYTKMDKQFAYINSLNITPYQKTALALAQGISEKNINSRAPW